MLSRVKNGINEFEWDNGNLDKSYLKHGITPKEAEEVFVNDGSLVLPDIEHSQREERFILVGINFIGVNIFVVFTFRKNKVRIISARRMHRKEVERYDKIKKNS
jgi:hypothetical protein